MVATGEMNVTAIQDRVTRILKDPKSEWNVIDAEATDTAKLYGGYIVPLAAIPAIAGFIGLTVFGVFGYRLGFMRGLSHAIVNYVLTLVGVYICALVIDKLAPTFESKPSTIQALKLVAYASTASWIAGVVTIIPALAPIAIIGGLYSIYLFYLGLPVLMKTPQAKVVQYMVVSAIIVIVVLVLVNFVSGTIVGVGLPQPL